MKYDQKLMPEVLDVMIILTLRALPAFPSVKHRRLPMPQPSLLSYFFKSKMKYRYDKKYQFLNTAERNKYSVLRISCVFSPFSGSFPV